MSQMASHMDEVRRSMGMPARTAGDSFSLIAKDPLKYQALELSKCEFDDVGFLKLDKLERERLHLVEMDVLTEADSREVPENPNLLRKAAYSGTNASAAYVYGCFLSTRLGDPSSLSQSGTAAEDDADASSSSSETDKVAGIPSFMDPIQRELKELQSAGFEVGMPAKYRAQPKSFTDAKAIDFQRLAASLGSVPAMVILGQKLLSGEATPQNTRAGSDWLYESYKRGVVHNAFGELVRGCMSVLEIAATSNMLLQMQHSSRLPSGTSVMLGGPNLGSFLCWYDQDLVRDAGAHDDIVQGLKEFGLLYRSLYALEKLATKMELFTLFQCGRRDAFAGATRQAYKNAKLIRDPRSPVMALPAWSLDAASDAANVHAPLVDFYSDADAQAWKTQYIASAQDIKELYFIAPPACVHQPEPDSAKVHCDPCFAAGIRRLFAAAAGLYALSEGDRVVEGEDARVVVYVDSHGNTMREYFKSYTHADVDTFVHLLYRGRTGDQPNRDLQERSELLMSPFFLAQDPNLFWPVIGYYGSFRAAFHAVVGERDWRGNNVQWATLLGSERARPVFPPRSECGPFGWHEKRTRMPLVRLCGNAAICTNLDTREKKFQKCGKCLLRSYCSPECSRQDWPKHKLECCKPMPWEHSTPPKASLKPSPKPTPKPSPKPTPKLCPKSSQKRSRRRR